VDTKIESKILLSALVGAPLGVGIVLAIDGQIYGWLLIILSLIVLIWLWKPWKWFQKKDKHEHK